MGAEGHIEQLQPGSQRLPRFNPGGNFCGHAPDMPAFRTTIKKLAAEASHPLLRRAILSIGEYYQHPALLKSIDRILASGEYRKKRKDGKHRKTRSERRDAIAMVFAYSLSEVNLMKCQVGKIPYSDFSGLLADTYDTIADKLGLSLIRVRRAFQHLKNAGYISITPRRIRQNDGSYKSLSAVIRIQECVFSLLGISKEWLERARQHQYNKWKSERNKRFAKSVRKQSERARAETMADYLFHRSQLEENDLLKDILETVSRFPDKSRRWKEKRKGTRQ
ncbi:MAG: hypothetical protein R3208_19795 [Ketobacteraceae bacterium]|nr:hypothetical protein [Ketobacteraceae bacterium]